MAGQRLPPFELPGLDGSPVQPDLSAGHPLVINFWATWCPPCRAEMAGLERIHRNLKARGLRVYGVSVDDDLNLVREFILKEGLTFPILMDRAGALAHGRFGIGTYPTTVLVRADGRVAEVAVGERAWDVPPASESVQALF